MSLTWLRDWARKHPPFPQRENTTPFSICRCQALPLLAPCLLALSGCLYHLVFKDQGGCRLPHELIVGVTIPQLVKCIWGFETNSCLSVFSVIFIILISWFSEPFPEAHTPGCYLWCLIGRSRCLTQLALKMHTTLGNPCDSVCSTNWWYACCHLSTWRSIHLHPNCPGKHLPCPETP